MSAHPQVPLSARVELAHAAVQALADDRGIRVLHIKGPAADPTLRAGTSAGSDVDIIVDPCHVPTLLTTLRAAGWTSITDFTTGSAFDHAANLFHHDWGLLDVHRTYPGLDRDPQATFERLWATRQTLLLAHYPCAVPDRTAQALVVLLHAARSPHLAGELHPDAGPAWFERTDAERLAVSELAADLGAQVALAAATGRLDELPTTGEAALWVWFAKGGTRLEEWQARLRAAPTWRARLSVIRRAFLVNEYYLAQRLGHDPTPAEIRREALRRLGHAARDATHGWRRAGRRLADRYRRPRPQPSREEQP